jgi:hypothetical protein
MLDLSVCVKSPIVPPASRRICVGRRKEKKFVSSPLPNT